jgi:hypothetical protein
MQSIVGSYSDSPRGSEVSGGDFGAGSDIDMVARDIDEDLKEALCDFELEKEGLEDVDTEVEDYEDGHGPDDPPSRADSDRKDLSDCDEQEDFGSDEEVPKQDVLNKLTRLATQLSMTVEKLRKRSPVL